MKKFSLALLLIILTAGIFLRVYGIGASFGFEGELGRELLYLRTNYLAGKLPLIGLTTSHEWLSYGPFYYWFMLPIFAAFRGNPFILYWSALIVSAFGLILNYFVVKRITDEKIALVSTLLEAISPLLIWQTKLSKLHVFFFVLTPVLMYLFYLVWNGNKKWVFWLGLVFGLMFSFHFSQIPLLGVIVLLFWMKKNLYKPIDWLKFATGVIVPNITLLWQDKSILLWLPYRALNPLDKNFSGTFSSLSEFLGRLLFWDQKIWFLGAFIFLLILGHYIWSNRSKLRHEFLPFYLISSVGLILAANVLHGGVPVHYFLPIFIIVPILYAIYLVKVKWGFLILILLAILNFQGYFDSRITGGFVDYSKQIEAANFIVFDARSKPFSIKRIGLFNYFPENYSQNYKYLVLWKGGNLIENSPNVYKIVEDNGNVEVEK